MANDINLTDKQRTLLQGIVSYALSNIDDISDSLDADYTEAAVKALAAKITELPVEQTAKQSKKKAVRVEQNQQDKKPHHELCLDSEQLKMLRAMLYYVKDYCEMAAVNETLDTTYSSADLTQLHRACVSNSPANVAYKISFLCTFNGENVWDEDGIFDAFITEMCDCATYLSKHDGPVECSKFVFDRIE